MILQELPLTIAGQVDELYDEIATTIALKRMEIEVVEQDIEYLQNRINIVRQERIDRLRRNCKEKLSLENILDEIQKTILSGLSYYDDQVKRDIPKTSTLLESCVDYGCDNCEYKKAIIDAFVNEALPPYAISQQAKLCRYVHFLTLYETQLDAMKLCTNDNISRLQVDKERRIQQNEMEKEKLLYDILLLEQQIEQLKIQIDDVQSMHKQALRRIKVACQLIEEYEIVYEVNTILKLNYDESSSSGSESCVSDSVENDRDWGNDDENDDENDKYDSETANHSIHVKTMDHNSTTGDIETNPSKSSLHITNGFNQINIRTPTSPKKVWNKQNLQSPFKLPRWPNATGSSSSTCNNNTGSHQLSPTNQSNTITSTNEGKLLSMWFKDKKNNLHEKISIKTDGPLHFKDDELHDSNKPIQTMISTISKVVEQNVADIRVKLPVVTDFIYNDKFNKELEDNDYFIPIHLINDPQIISIDNFLDESVGSDFDDIDIITEVQVDKDCNNNTNSILLSSEIIIESIDKMKAWFAASTSSTIAVAAKTSNNIDIAVSHSVADSLREQIFGNHFVLSQLLYDKAVSYDNAATTTTIISIHDVDCSIHDLKVEEDQHVVSGINSDFCRRSSLGQTTKIKLRET